MFSSHQVSSRAGIARRFTISATDRPFSKSAPVGQTCTHLPQPVQVSDDPQGSIEIGDDLAVDAAAHHVPGMRAFDFVANPHAAGAQNAAVVIDDEALVRGIDRQLADNDRDSECA